MNTPDTLAELKLILDMVAQASVLVDEMRRIIADLKKRITDLEEGCDGHVPMVVAIQIDALKKRIGELLEKMRQ